jgi:cellulose synthase/poly-beta-1,6-N-acetylglucosamine synthase-like glycosyltransferase
MNPQISVIIPVYNAVRALELVLAGYSRQSFGEFDVWIADDGSGPAVREFVETSVRQVPFRLRYVYQPDEGFRRSSILNLAVRQSDTGYLIFADGDCIPHRNFVRGHWERRGAGTVLCGRRVHLAQGLSEALTAPDVVSGALERITPGRLIDALLGRGGHWDEGIQIRNRLVHEWVNYKEPTILGSNFSLGRPLLEEVNGFNEDFVGYGGEDTELEYRLRLAGARLGWVRHLAIQYHLYHPARAGSPANLGILSRTHAEGRPACRNGLRKHP